LAAQLKHNEVGIYGDIRNAVELRVDGVSYKDVSTTMSSFFKLVVRLRANVEIDVES
jgi:hypothetical protein